jgi:hypothetical protein
MLAVPFLLLVVLPFGVGLAATLRSGPDLASFLDTLPGPLAEELGDRPNAERLVLLVNGYLLAPLFLIVPLMVSAVLAADAFAGEKERRTLEGLLHLPISDRDLFLAKLATAFLPAMAVSWLGFLAFAIVSNGVAWPVMHRIFVPTQLWAVVIFWVAPAVAALGLGVMVRVSARAKTSQEANQLGGAVIPPSSSWPSARAPASCSSRSRWRWPSAPSCGSSPSGSWRRAPRSSRETPSPSGCRSRRRAFGSSPRVWRACSLRSRSRPPGRRSRPPADLRGDPRTPSACGVARGRSRRELVRARRPRCRAQSAMKANWAMAAPKIAKRSRPRTMTVAGRMAG